MKPAVAFDIETASTEAALALEPDESWLMNGVRDNFKPETVEKYRADNLAKWPDEISRRGSLDWRLGHIVAVGVGNGGVYVSLDDRERDIIRLAWDMLADNTIVGFAVRSFDLPWLMGRTAMLGLRAPRKLNLAKFRDVDVIDWAEILSQYGAFATSGWTLSRYCEWFGLDVKPFGAGKDVAEWVKAGDADSIRQHLEADLSMTNALHERCAPAFLGEAA